MVKGWRIVYGTPFDEIDLSGNIYIVRETNEKGKSIKRELTLGQVLQKIVKEHKLTLEQLLHTSKFREVIETYEEELVRYIEEEHTAYKPRETTIVANLMKVGIPYQTASCFVVYLMDKVEPFYHPRKYQTKEGRKARQYAALLAILERGKPKTIEMIAGPLISAWENEQKAQRGKQKSLYSRL